MNRRRLIGMAVVVIVLLFNITMALGQQETKIISRSENQMVVRDGELFHKLSLKDFAGKQTVIDTIFYYYEPTAPESYDDFLGSYQIANDTCVQRFKLLAPGKVNKFMMQNVNGGMATCYLWNPAVVWDEEGQGQYLWPDTSAIEQLFPFGIPLTCTATDPDAQFSEGVWTPTWNTLDIVNTIGQGVELHEDSLYFWLGYTLDASGGPRIYQDGNFHDTEFEGNCGAYSTLWAISPVWYSIISSADDTQYLNHMVQTEVVYDSLPPIISEVTKPSDTFSDTKTISATIVDLEGDAFTAELYSKAGINGEYTATTMSLVDGDVYAGDITGAPGDTIYFYVRAEDHSLANASRIYNYVIVEPPSGIPLLLINDGGQNNDSLYTLALDNLGQSYYYWDMKDHNGIDQSIIHYPDFNTMIVFGWGARIIPITDMATQDIFDIAGYLDNGGNLMFVDMDYLYSWGMPATGSFSAGDFAYDYLGLGAYENDPMDGDVSAADIEMEGIAGDPVTDPFVSPDYYGLIDYEMVGWQNWGDFIYPNDNATTIFHGKDNQESMAILMTGSNFKTVTFGFPIELVQNFEQFKTLLIKTLEWMGSFTAVEQMKPHKVLDTFKLAQNYPNPFNPTTSIAYNLPLESQVQIKVYNILGQHVRTLVNMRQEAGQHTIQWNGKDARGVTVSAGIYFYQMKAGKYRDMKKMFFIK